MGVKNMIILTKRDYTVLLISACIFIIASYFLYGQAGLKEIPHHDVDSKAYVMNAEFFYEHKSFASLGTVPYYTLGYPLWLGILFLLFGKNTLVVIIAQILLSLLSGFLVFLIARRLTDPMVARISVLFFSCNLGFLIFSQFILTEILLAFLLLLFFERFTAFMETKSLFTLATAALILGCSMVVKPAAIYYPVCLLVLIVALLRSSGLKKIVKAVALFCLLFYLPVATYRVHNKIVFNSFKFGSLDQVNILFWFFPHVLAEKHGTSSDYERVQLKELEHKWGISWIKSLLWQNIRENPFLVAYSWFKNTFKTWFGLYVANLKLLVDPTIFSGQFSFFRMQGSWYERAVFYVKGNTSLYWVKVIGVLECIWQIVRYPLVLVGLYYFLRSKQYAILFFFTSYLGYFSLITGHDGCARFRMMFEAQIVVLTALGLWVIFTCKRERNEERLCWYACWRKRFSAMASK